MKALALVVIATISAGCATRYKADGISGGYTEQQLAPNVYAVEFSGNGFTGSQRAVDFALLRAAELAVDKKYRYFAIISAGRDVRISQANLPTTVNTYATPNYATSTIYPGQTIDIAKPSAKNTVAFFHDNPRGEFFDAQETVKSIRAKYHLRRFKTDEDLQSEIEAFERDPAHPHFLEVRADMAELLKQGKADTLQQAYDVAVKRAGFN
jgi:hypothetical protein